MQKEENQQKSSAAVPRSVALLRYFFSFSLRSSCCPSFSPCSISSLLFSSPEFSNRWVPATSW